MTTPNFSDFFVQSRNMPAKWEEASNLLNWYLQLIADKVNVRVIGLYSTTQTPSGKQYPVGQGTIDVSRKLVSFGALRNNTTKSVAHGLTVDDKFRLFELYISANDPVNFLYFCAKNWGIANTGDVQINIDDTNINVTTNGDYTAYSDCFVILEYMRLTS